MELNFRTLLPEEIEVRISTIKESGITLLLYKDARVDQNLLDEVAGAMNWQREHKSIDGRLYCTVSIYDNERAIWVSKQDVGTESYTEKEKGQASDSFKRACFNWGIGRELYTAPYIRIPSSLCSIKSINNKYVCYDKFEVSEIAYDDKKRIITLVINKDNNVVYSYGSNKKTNPKKSEKPKESKCNCEKCGKLFEAFRYEDKDYTAEDAYEWAKEAGKRRGDNKVLCNTCIKEEKNVA